MADEQQFIENGIQRSRIDEFFAEELGRAGYGGMDLAQTPMGTQIVLKAEKPGMVIGKGGKNIREITQTLEDEFGLEDPQVDVQEVEEPDLNAQIVADRLANALERGWYFRKAGHTTLERIMDAGALGAEIVLSGKVTGARGRVEKFSDGYIKHNGEPAEEIVDRGKGVSVVQLGTIGVNVKIIPPGADLPDDFGVREDVDTEDLEAAPEDGGVEELIAEPDETDEDVEQGTEPERDVDEEVIEEAAEEVAEEEIEAEEGAAETSPPDTETDEVEVPDDDDVEDIDVDELDAAVEEELDEDDDLDEDAEAEAEDLMEEMDEAESDEQDTDDDDDDEVDEE